MTKNLSKAGYMKATSCTHLSDKRRTRVNYKVAPPQLHKANLYFHMDLPLVISKPTSNSRTCG